MYQEWRINDIPYNETEIRRALLGTEDESMEGENPFYYTEDFPFFGTEDVQETTFYEQRRLPRSRQRDYAKFGKTVPVDF